MTSTVTRFEWAKVKGACAACGHKNWCTQSPDGLVIKCMRAESSKPIKQKDGTIAWLHRIGELGGSPATARPTRERPRLSTSELKNLQKRYQSAINPRRLASMAAALGLKEKSLRAMGIGWADDYRAWSFPMVDGNREIVGMRLRHEDGRKACVVGSRNGLFVPQDYEAFEIPALLARDTRPWLILMPEGPTDAAAAMDMGFRAIGRPSCNGGFDYLKRLLNTGPKQEIVVVADNDETKYLADGTPFWPGIEGAVGLCEAILPVCGILRFALPPAGAKDLREWLKNGNVADAVDVMFVRAQLVSHHWLERAHARLKERKKNERRKAG